MCNLRRLFAAIHERRRNRTMAVFGTNNQASTNNVRAVTEMPEKEVVQMQLNNGTGPDGKVKTVNQNLGSLNPNEWDAQKVMNVVEYLSPCLSKSVYAVQHVKTTTLVD